MGKHALIESSTVAFASDYAPRQNKAYGAPHYYLKRELADSSVSHLMPWCQLGKLVPELHERADISNQVPPPESRFQICRECRAELEIVRAGCLS